MKQIANLEPKTVWRQFVNISQLPHPSGCLDVLRQYIVDTARAHQFETLVDEAGNILVRTGDTPEICLQAHYDMVPQKDNGVEFDFTKDPLQLRIVGNEVMATGTTLGADNGIGVAAMLALIEAKNTDGKFADLPLEFLFTANEETGMQGARKLSADWIRSRQLINLDSEEEGVLMTGCAGAVNMTASLKFKMDADIPEGDAAVLLCLTGLQGGHSGMDIHLGRANACKLMNRFLKHIVVNFEARLGSFNGGTLRNAIPREAQAVITVPEEIVDEVIEEVGYYNDLFREEYQQSEPGLSFTAKAVPMPGALIPEEIQDDLLNAIEACHDGVWTMGEGYVDTSSNMAHVQTTADGEAEVLLMVRSMNEERKRACASAIQSAFLLGGFRVDFAASYGAWNIEKDAPMVQKALRANPNLRLDKVHCGLECGVITEIYPDMQIISVGPTIHHPHSPQESVEIESVAKFWNFLIQILRL
ncbi:MAG: beta-Ala-His dipeptidase [Bacteroidales bacterium]|nr:beta-Ala-His dipeptidase [Bacteroidales bacterium]